MTAHTAGICYFGFRGRKRDYASMVGVVSGHSLCLHRCIILVDNCLSVGLGVWQGHVARLGAFLVVSVVTVAVIWL